MRLSIFLLVIFILSCDDDSIIPLGPGESCCGINPLYLSLHRHENGVKAQFGFNGHYDGNCNFCYAEQVSLFVSTNGNQFDFYERKEIGEKEFIIDNLDQDQTYYFYLEGEKDNFSPYKSPAYKIRVGEPQFPEQLPESPLGSIRSFSISPNNKYILYKTFNNLWYLIERNNPSAKRFIHEGGSSFTWFEDSQKLIFIESTPFDNFKFSYKLLMYNLVDDTINELLRISESEEKSISNPNPSIDGNKIYYRSNIPNGEFELWEVSIETKKIKKISNLTNQDFWMRSMLKMPGQDDLFICTGDKIGNYGLELFLFDSSTSELSLLLEDGFKKKILDINPDGTSIVFESDQTGSPEIWLLELNTLEYNQISDRYYYGEDSGWKNVYFDEGHQLLTYLKYNDSWQFVKFELN